MTAEEKKDELLSSWKEIAEYLKCDLRTCRRWEENRGLPVHRLEGTPRSRVFAYTNELDDWVKKRNGKNGESGYSRTGAAVPLAKTYYLLILLVLIGVPSLYLFVIKPYLRPPVSYDFKIERSELVILDKKGDELWRYDTGREDLEDEAVYRSGFQTKKPGLASKARILPLLIIKDINNDKKKEVIFAVRTKDEMEEGDLHCFDRRGRELWSHELGKEMKFGSKTYSNDYMVKGFDAADLDGDGRLETLAIGYHRPDWPTQVVLLSAEGAVLAEYWHCGQINDYTFADIDWDGREEILLAGINNEYGKGCLAVLDAETMGGSSPQIRDEFKSPGLEPGSEKYYLLIPRTDVDMLNYPVEALSKLDLHAGNQVSVETLITGLYYFFDYNLRVKDITVSHGFMQMHNSAVLERKISSVLDDLYIEELKKGILYYDGSGWTSDPTSVSRR